MILEKAVRVRCPDAEIETWVRDLYRPMQRRSDTISDPDLEYRIERCADSEGFRVQEGDGPAFLAETPGQSLDLFEAALTIALQLLRPDLLFVHAAALAGEKGVIGLVGDSGTGKSTLSWALSHYSLSYLSDELAPFDPAEARVVPFPRAIHLKKTPPGPWPLPPTYVDTGLTLCVPVDSLAGGFTGSACELDALLFLAPPPRPTVPTIRPLSAGVAVSRLFAGTLNALAHPPYGIDAVVRIARHARCYEVAASSSDLEATCELIRSVV